MNKKRSLPKKGATYQYHLVFFAIDFERCGSIVGGSVGHTVDFGISIVVYSGVYLHPRLISLSLYTRSMSRLDYPGWKDTCICLQHDYFALCTRRSIRGLYKARCAWDRPTDHHISTASTLLKPGPLGTPPSTKSCEKDRTTIHFSLTPKPCICRQSVHILYPPAAAGTDHPPINNIRYRSSY